MIKRMIAFVCMTLAMIGCDSNPRPTELPNYLVETTTIDGKDCIIIYTWQNTGITCDWKKD